VREEQLAQRKEVIRENKADDEDYEQIDNKFNKIFAELNVVLTQWNDLTNKEEIETFFEQVFAKFSSLREYVNMYTFAIPATFFSLYQ
jgi:uncharacterized protein YpuA (DUF1002 family)